MSIYRRAGSTRWWCRIPRENGAPIRESTGTGVRSEALRYEARRRLELAADPSTGTGKSWDDAVRSWLNELSTRRSTEEYYSRILLWLDKRLRGVDLHRIDAAMVAEIRTARGWKRGGLASASTINNTMQCLGSVLKHAQQRGWIAKVPPIKYLRNQNQVVRWLERDEVAALLAELDGPLKAMVLVAINTGLRRTNIVGLRWSQVDLASRVIRIQADEMKTGRDFVVPLNSAAIEAIRSQLGKHATHVFQRCGRPFSGWPYESWNAALNRAGIKNFRVHDLRHHWASMHVMAGTPLHVLKELGGWSSINMVMRYAHLSTQHLSEYAESVNCGPSEVLHIHKHRA